MTTARAASNFKLTLIKHLILDDFQAVEIILSVVAAHKIPGEMLWLRLIGSPGTGKTEILSSLSGQDGYCSRIESLTPSSIRRGFKPGDKAQLPTMLERIKGKLVITKELAPLLTSNKELKVEVFGLLRSVHDGELVADYGSWEGHLVQQTHFDWILGSTRYVDRQAALEGLLGSRFIDLRWGSPIDRKKAIAKARSNDGKLPEIRQEIAGAMSKVIETADPDALDCSLLDDTFLTDIADFVSTYRTVVERDSRTKEVVEVPDPELGTRVGQAFSRIAKGLLMIGITEYKPHLQRLALDCILPLRASLIRGLMEGCDTEDTLADYMKVSQATAHYTKEDLRLLGFKRDQLSLMNGGD